MRLRTNLHQLVDGRQNPVTLAKVVQRTDLDEAFQPTAVDLAQIEYAAEMGLEHHLGLTCDPVCGLVQIPCIEGNAVAAARALDANSYANLSDGHHMISYDRVVEVMKETGKDIPSLYRETSEGGLARNYTQK